MTLESLNELLTGHAVVEEGEKGRYTVTLTNGIKWVNVCKLELLPHPDGVELRPTWLFASNTESRGEA